MFSILAASLIFGLVHPGSKWILGQGIDLLSFCILYVLIRWLAQIPFVLRTRSYRVSGRWNGLLLLLIGLVGAALQFSEFMGIADGLPVPIVAFLVYSHPIWSMLFSRVINKERFTAVAFVQVTLGILGIVCITEGEIVLANLQLARLLPPLFAGVMIALWISLANKAKKSGTSAGTISFYFDLFALLALLGVRSAHLVQSAPILEAVTWLHSARHFWAIAGYSIFVGLVPNLLFYRGSMTTPARTAGLVLLIEPVVATFASHWIWQDSLPPLFLLGTALILFAGLPIAQWQVRKPRIQWRYANPLLLLK